jgi:formylglycine-generating enzyme required for sulfatase activity
VTLGGFWMAKYALTKRQWKAVMDTTPWSGQRYVIEDLDSPAVCLTWNSAKSFLTAVNSYTGKTFRLPSEAEWEYACRAGTTARYYWGDDPSYTAIGAYAWYDGNAYNVTGQQYAHVVGAKLPNTFGLYDMSGNVWQWCQDWYHNNYTGAPTDGRAWESPTGSYRVLRGGSWSYNDSRCRSASRSSGAPSGTNDNIGCRVVQIP